MDCQSLFSSQKIGSDIPFKVSPEKTIGMKCQSLYLGKMKNIINLPSAEIAHRMVMVNMGPK